MISCLTVSNRPEWHPWVKHQVGKQHQDLVGEHIIIDGSRYATIGEARTAALEASRHTFVAWFDDDDWSSAIRLDRALYWLLEGAVMVGNVSSWMLDSRLEGACALEYPGYGHVIFNGGVFAKGRMPKTFQSSNQGEDIDWVRRGALQGPAVLLPELQQAWLCHDKNVVNSRGRRLFEHTLPGVVRITDEERRLIP